MGRNNQHRKNDYDFRQIPERKDGYAMPIFKAQKLRGKSLFENSL
jgi:hypothetical protein